jgi:hypothetical protein
MVRLEYVLSREVREDPYHIELFRNVLPKQLEPLFLATQEEFEDAFREMMASSSSQGECLTMAFLAR